MQRLIQDIFLYKDMQMKWHTNYFYVAFLVKLMVSVGYLKGDHFINICLPGLAHMPIPALSQFVKKNKQQLQKIKSMQNQTYTIL